MGSEDTDSGAEAEAGAGAGAESTALVPRDDTDLAASAARTPDAYEAKYMSEGGMVLHRDKSVAPWPLHAAFGGIAAVATLAAVLDGALIVLPFILPMLFLMWMLFGVLRTTVTEGAVKIQYGLFGPTIPIDSIVSAEATTYDWKKFGGWGIKANRKGEWIYNMPGDKGRAVRIKWRNKKGKEKVTLVGTPEPGALAAAIHEAHGALPPAPDAGAIEGGERKALPEGDDSA